MLLAMRSWRLRLRSQAVILKPDPRRRSAEGWSCRMFEEAGLPPGVFQRRQWWSDRRGGSGRGQRSLHDHFHRIDHGRRRVGELAGRHLKRVAAGARWQSPFHRVRRRDLEAAASPVHGARSLHPRTDLHGDRRHIVHRKVVSDYLEILTRPRPQLYPLEILTGSKLPWPDHQRADKLPVLFRSSRTVLPPAHESYGRHTHRSVTTNQRCWPDVRPAMPAYDLEIFGPVAVVVVAEDEDDAVRIANDTDYGLSGAWQTGSLERGLRVAVG